MEKTYTITEVARALGLKRASVHKAIRALGIEPIVVENFAIGSGKAFFLTEQDLALLRQRKTTPGPKKNVAK